MLSNHYHVMLHAPEGSVEGLPALIRDMHKFLAGRWNKADRTPGRMVWYNYWDTCITDERSYRARINYIHWNPVKHGLVARPEDYVFSSYRTYFTQPEKALPRWEK